MGSGEEPVPKIFLEFHPRKDILEHFYTLFNKPKSVFCNGNAYSVPTNIISAYQLLYRHNKISSMCSRPTVTLTQSNQRHWVVPPPQPYQLLIGSGRIPQSVLGTSEGDASPQSPRGYATAPYAPRSSRFGSELPSMAEDVDLWCYAIVSCMLETTTTTSTWCWCSLDATIRRPLAAAATGLSASQRANWLIHI